MGSSASVLLVLAILALALLGSAAPAGAATATGTPAATGPPSGPALTLLSQTPWLAPGGVFDLHLHTAVPTVPTADLGVGVSVYSCLSSVSGFDQSLVGTPTGSPVSSTSSPIPVAGLATVPGGMDLPMPVVVGSGSSTATTGAPFTIHLQTEGEQCQSFPAGVFPVHVELVDTRTSTPVGSFTTHLVMTDSPGDTERLRVGVVLPVQVTQTASHDPSPVDLLVRPTAALAAPSPSVVSATVDTVAAVTLHQAVPVTLQVSGQTVELLSESGHQAAISQLADLAATPDVHQLTAAPFTPVDASALVGSGLADELALQVARGVTVVGAATGHQVNPTSASAGLGPWITGDGLDPATVGALSTDGFRQVVLPAADLSATPSTGSTTEPFALDGARGQTVLAMASDDDLTARFTADPGDPVLAAHQLVAELAQLYYERPNGITPRAVMAVAPATWTDDPAFVDALLGSLDGNPIIQASTTSQVFSLFDAPATCRSGCRLTGGSTTGGLPAAAIRAQRSRVNGFAASAVGVRSLAQQLGDLVLSGESRTLRPAQQSAVIANAGAAVDAQVDQLAVEGEQSVTLTASSGTLPVTVFSNAPYPVNAQLVLSSDKLLFPNGETSWSTPVTLDPHRSTVVYVHVRSRASGVFRLDVSLRSPDGTMRLVTGELSVRSTSSSVVGVVLTAAAMVVLVVWWVRTSRRRKAQARADEAADAARAAAEEARSSSVRPAEHPTGASTAPGIRSDGPS